MLEFIEIYTDSRHYQLPTDIPNDKYASPRRHNDSDFTFYLALKKPGGTTTMYYHRNAYLIEQKRGCRPVLLIPFIGEDSKIVSRLTSTLGRPGQFFKRTVRMSRYELWQRWKSVSDKHI